MLCVRILLWFDWCKCCEFRNSVCMEVMREICWSSKLEGWVLEKVAMKIAENWLWIEEKLNSVIVMESWRKMKVQRKFFLENNLEVSFFCLSFFWYESCRMNCLYWIFSLNFCYMWNESWWMISEMNPENPLSHFCYVAWKSLLDIEVTSSLDLIS